MKRKSPNALVRDVARDVGTEDIINIANSGISSDDFVEFYLKYRATYLFAEACNRLEDYMVSIDPGISYRKGICTLGIFLYLKP